MQNNYDWNPIKRKNKPKMGSDRLVLIGGATLIAGLIIVAILVFAKGDDNKQNSQSNNTQSEQQDNSTQNTTQNESANNTTTESDSTKKEEPKTTTPTDSSAPAAATPAENQAAIQTVLNSIYTGGASSANTCNLVPRSYTYSINTLDAGNATVTVVTQNTNGASKTINLTMKKSGTNWAITTASCS